MYSFLIILGISYFSKKIHISPYTINNSIIIFCQDAPSDTLWRHEFAECYKGNRIDLSEKYNFKPTNLDICLSQLVPAHIN